MRYGYGIDLGGTTVKLAYFEENGTLLEKWEIPTRTDDGGKHILPDIAAAIHAHREKHAGQIIGIGIGVPGPVEDDGVVNGCVNLGWGRVAIARELSALTGCTVKAGNDANVAALGEYWMGGGRGCKSMVFVTLGTGVGGGIVLNGKLLNGTHGAGAEIGHMVLDRQETERCGCGKCGCAEQYCSATGVVRLAKRALAQTEEPSVLRTLADMTCKDVFDAAAAQDKVACAALEVFYARLGELLADICCVIDPDAVVIGGGVSKAGQVILDGVRPHFKRMAFHGASGARFALARLGNDAGAYGAFKLVLDAQEQ